MNIESRVAELEQQNRLLRVIALGGLLLAALPWALGSRAEVEDTIRAKSFTLVDDDGVVRGSWSFEPNTKMALLRIQSPDGSAAIVLDTNPESAVARNAAANVVLTASPAGNSLKMDTGVIAIAQRGKPDFVAPPKMSVIPVTRP